MFDKILLLFHNNINVYMYVCVCVCVCVEVLCISFSMDAVKYKEIWINMYETNIFVIYYIKALCQILSTLQIIPHFVCH